MKFQTFRILSMAFSQIYSLKHRIKFLPVAIKKWRTYSTVIFRMLNIRIQSMTYQRETMKKIGALGNPIERGTTISGFIAITCLQLFKSLHKLYSGTVRVSHQNSWSKKLRTLLISQRITKITVCRLNRTKIKMQKNRIKTRKKMR